MVLCETQAESMTKRDAVNAAVGMWEALQLKHQKLCHLNLPVSCWHLPLSHHEAAAFFPYSDPCGKVSSGLESLQHWIKEREMK